MLISLQSDRNVHQTTRQYCRNNASEIRASAASRHQSNPFGDGQTLNVHCEYTNKKCAVFSRTIVWHEQGRASLWLWILREFDADDGE